MRIEAATLDEAYALATAEFNCSVNDLEINIIQLHKAGFLGFFKKNAIIECNLKKEQKKENFSNQKPRAEKTHKFEHKEQKKSKKRENRPEKIEKPENVEKQEPKAKILEEKKPEVRSKKFNFDNSILDNFHKTNNENIVDVVAQIKQGVENLFAKSCFEIYVKEVSMANSDTILIKLDGEDSALLIGKEGYRYKAISYLLFNWINSKYNLSIRLEIAEFLKNQELMMDSYLQNIIQKVKTNGKAQTKPLDGVLVKIALEKLREKFPDKYVGIKSNDDGKFVVINDFHKKND